MYQILFVYSPTAETITINSPFKSYPKGNLRLLIELIIHTVDNMVQRGTIPMAQGFILVGF